jgi:hypothetical protein
MSILKTCNKCKKEKNCNNFNFSQFKNKFGRCKECISHYNKKYREDNLDKIKESDRKSSMAYYSKNKKEILDKYNKKHYNGTRQRFARSKQFSIKNYNKEYQKNKRKNNVQFKLKTNISANINFYLKVNDKSKNKKSTLKHLPYKVDELKIHLESLFQPWMNWNNYGKYNPKTWDDGDSATWTWQIDHVIPHSTFNYSSMEDADFKRCWSLSNLRPYSSKDNFMDGVRRVRHFK